MNALLPFTPAEIGYPQRSTHWREARDADLYALMLFRRHYSYRHSRNPETRHFAGPAEKMVLLSNDGRALFVWRRENFRVDRETGVYCSIFRNEGAVLSSLLILEAEKLAWARWPGERLFTHVDPTAIRGSNPGCCFRKAGWVRQKERTRVHGLVRLEKQPTAQKEVTE